MSTKSGDPSLSILDEVQRAQDRRRIRAQAPSDGRLLLWACTVYTGTVHPIPPRTPSSYGSTQIQSARTQLPRSSSQDSSPPSGILSKSPSLSGPPGSSVGAPTITQYPSAAPDGQTPAPCSPNTSTTPTRDRPSELQPPTTHTQLSIDVNFPA